MTEKPISKNHKAEISGSIELGTHTPFHYESYANESI